MESHNYQISGRKNNHIRLYVVLSDRPQASHASFEGTSGGRILGDDSFVEGVYEKSEQCEEKSETLDEIIVRVGKEYGLTEAEMSARGRQRDRVEARAMIAYLVREAPGLSLTELGRRMKRDVSTLSLSADKILRRSNYQNKGFRGQS